MLLLEGLAGKDAGAPRFKGKQSGGGPQWASRPFMTTPKTARLSSIGQRSAHCTRREFLVGTAATLALGTSAWAAERRRPRIAALTTTYYKYSHSEHIVDRFLE